MDRIAALMMTGNVHFFKLKKMGSSRMVYPVQEIGEASREAMIPSAETYSKRSKFPDDFSLDKTSRAKTAIRLMTRPKDKPSNLEVKPNMELFPGMIKVSRRKADASSH